MPDRVVALQLLSSYWLAVILPPLPGILCFSAIYNNERISAFSSVFSHNLHQGRKFGGYKILPKPCKNSSSTEKDNIGICMFNYECTQRAGTVVGSCMDGFLYGTCCKLPAGVSLPTVNVPETTSSKPLTFATSDRSTIILKPHIEHSPEETVLLYKNGTVVQNVYSPDDYLSFTKYHTPSTSHTSPIPNTFSTKAYTDKHVTSSPPKMTTDEGISIPQVPNNISPSQIFDLAMSFTTKLPTSVANNQQDRLSTLQTPKPYITTFSSREPFSPNFSSKYSPSYSTKITQYTTNRTTDFFSSSNKFSFTSSINDFPITDRNDIEDNDENLIRVPTLTADNVHKFGNNSIDHILWLLNDTKMETEPEIDLATQPTQSFYTWLSIQNNPDKTPSQYFSTKPVTHSSYFDSVKPNTLPSTTVHHIPGPSFHVTPEVKITPKPQASVGESVPTVIVLSSAQDTSSPPPNKKPTYGYTTTASYNVSYHFPPQTSSSSKPPFIKPAYLSQPSDKPTYNLLITAKPSNMRPSTQQTRPNTQQTKPTENSSSNISPSKPNNNHLFSALPITSSPLAVHKPVKTTVTSALQYTKIKPQTEPASTSSLPSIMQTTVVTTAKPIFSSSANFPDIALKPLYSALPIPAYTNSLPALSTSSYVSVRPPSTSNIFGITPQILFEDNPTYPLYPGTNVIFNSTEDLIAFPPVRDPNINFTATQQEKPIITSTTTFGDEDADVNPQFVVDKTLEDKMHVFVEKIVQSLQGNFEDLERVLISGESTNNVTVNNSPTKKPVSKKPTKKPNTSGKPTLRPKPGSTLSVTSTLVTKKPTKKPSLATPILLFQPSTSLNSISVPTKKPIKVTSSTTISIFPSSSPADSLFNATEEEENLTVRPNIEENIDYRRTCGIRPLAKKNGRIVGGKGSSFGQWPWQVLVKEATWLGLFTKNKCGGVLITNKYVITAAHCQPGFLANLVAVFGEYDISGEIESKRSISKNVRRVIVHRQYDAATFENDIALLELESPIQFDTHIVPICMPEDDEDFTGRMATVTGWGRLKYGGGVPSVLQEVQVPVIENRVCQEMFQTAGHSKVILSSFLCAGYANGQRDSCEGDSGGPLMIEREDGHWVLVATVSHGIKCAAPYLPGVYMRTTYYKPWLQTITGVQ